MASVILVVPPFGSVDSPSLGVSTLVAACAQRNLPAKAAYENLQFAKILGLDAYSNLALSPAASLVGEAIFSKVAFPEDFSNLSAEEIVDSTIDAYQTHGSTAADAASSLRKTLDRCVLVAAISAVEEFVANSADRILTFAPKVVGFSSTFQQTNASIAIARQIRSIDQSIHIILGGANAASPMGEEIARVSGVFDVVFSGEADVDFPAYIEAYLRTPTPTQSGVIDCKPITNMEELPIPDYSDYFLQLSDLKEESQEFSELPRWVYFETSRGCWWGQKHHCTFCGLNASGMNHREKSAERALKEIELVYQKYAVERFQATDNILPISYFRSFLPMLADEHNGIFDLFYEVKSNLKESDLDLFLGAGLSRIQPGIESLSTEVLRIMRKGVSGPQNIALLRECGSRGIYVAWNLLMGFPGESMKAYSEMSALLPLMEHLQPPTGWGFVRFDRFSPYHFEAEKHGIRNLRPLPAYSNVFPEGANLEELAYYFIGDYESAFLTESKTRTSIEETLRRWKSAWETDERRLLDIVEIPKVGTLLFDTRSFSTNPVYALSDNELDTLRFLQMPRRREALSEKQEKLVDQFLESGSVVEHEGLLISLVREPVKAGVAQREEAIAALA